MPLLRDLRFAVRHTIRHPGFAATAAGTLALGIGAAVATFSIVDTVMLRWLPYDAPDRLVAVWETRPTRGADRLNASPANFMVRRERTDAFEALAGFTVRTRELAGLQEPQRIQAVQVTSGFFRALGIDMTEGRGFTSVEHEAGDHRVAVLGHGLWRSRFGGDPEAVGRTLEVEGVPRHPP